MSHHSTNITLIKCTQNIMRVSRHVHSDLGVGYKFFFSDLDLLGPRHLDPIKYFKIFKYVIGPYI